MLKDIKVGNDDAIGERCRWSTLVVLEHVSSEGSQTCFVGKEVFELGFEDG